MNTTSIEGNAVIEGHVPLSDMFGYSTDLRSGHKKVKANLQWSFHYAAVPRTIQEELAKKYAEKRAAK